MPRKAKPPSLTLTTPETAPPPPAQLPLKAVHGVRLTLEGTDFAAVEAAAAELKARFGTRFAITGRRPTARREALRITGSLVIGSDDALDAEGGR